MTGRSIEGGTPQALHDLHVADARWRAVAATMRDAIIAIDRHGRSRGG